MLQHLFYIILRHSEDVFETNKVKQTLIVYRSTEKTKTEGRVSVQFQLPFAFSLLVVVHWQSHFCVQESLKIT